MGIDHIVDISRQGFFSLEQANEVLAVVRGITAKYAQSVDGKMARLESIDNSQIDLISELETEINEEIQEWHTKVKKLGGEPKGLWLIDFDSGHGYYCWKYPEPEILYWHRYSDGFSGRITIEEMQALSLCESAVPTAPQTEAPALN